jgi:hypothetical protein
VSAPMQRYEVIARSNVGGVRIVRVVEARSEAEAEQLLGAALEREPSPADAGYCVLWARRACS